MASKNAVRDQLQIIPLSRTRPSEENCRLFIECESLAKLRKRYRDDSSGIGSVLPDPPILRIIHKATAPHICPKCDKQFSNTFSSALCQNNPDGTQFEIVAGERRITAATLEHVQFLPCRVVEMTDEEAYRFIVEHNSVESVTTPEIAFRAAEMARLGFTAEEISDVLGGVSVSRYTTVGAMVNPDWFTDHPKLCNPGILEWYEAAAFGPQHFAKCFRMWNRGVWDEKQCSRYFRKRGDELPRDNAEKGFRVTFDLNRLVVRGQVDLDMMGAAAAEAMIDAVSKQLLRAKAMLRQEEHFGLREVFRINPTTL